MARPVSEADGSGHQEDGEPGDAGRDTDADDDDAPALLLDDALHLRAQQLDLLLGELRSRGQRLLEELERAEVVWRGLTGPVFLCQASTRCSSLREAWTVCSQALFSAPPSSSIIAPRYSHVISTTIVPSAPYTLP